MIAEGEADYEEAKKTILPIMAAYDLESHVIKGVGTAKTRVNRGSSINSKKLREALLLQNMEPDRINEVVESSSTKWATEYLEFKPVWGDK